MKPATPKLWSRCIHFRRTRTNRIPAVNSCAKPHLHSGAACHTAVASYTELAGVVPVPRVLPKLLTEAQAIELLQLKPSTLNTWRALRKGPPGRKIGGSARYPQQDLAIRVEHETANPMI